MLGNCSVIITSPSKALKVACLTPRKANPITDNNHSPNNTNLASVPMDFNFLTIIFSPKINRKKNGIPTAKKVSKDITQIGAPIAAISI